MSSNAKAQTLEEEATNNTEVPIQKVIESQQDINKSIDFKVSRYPEEELRDHVLYIQQMNKKIAKKQKAPEPKTKKIDPKNKREVKRFLESQKPVYIYQSDITD